MSLRAGSDRLAEALHRVRNPFGHVDLRVSSMADALPSAAEGELPSAAYFGLVEAPGHAPHANRIAFWVDGPEEVDRIAALARAHGANEISGPKPMPYGPDYYTVFFEDPSGNPLEVYYRRLG
jgi:catechol 2,3-dioxygenase-like lactoylglutathione lyase family enzyme